MYSRKSYLQHQFLVIQNVPKNSCWKPMLFLKGVGTILSQQGDDGEFNVIAYASRS